MIRKKLSVRGDWGIQAGTVVNFNPPPPSYCTVKKSYMNEVFHILSQSIMKKVGKHFEIQYKKKGLIRERKK